MIRASAKEIARFLGVKMRREELTYKPHVFPRYPAPLAIKVESGETELTTMHFGLIPFFEKNAKPKMVFHNARIETVSEKASFKRPFVASRALVPMDSFLEYIWVTEKENWLAKFSPKNGDPLVAAAITQAWKSPTGEILETFSILTTEPPNIVRETGHDRCPVFLNRSTWDSWLDPAQKDPKELLKILQSPETIDFEVSKVEKPKR